MNRWTKTLLLGAISILLFGCSDPACTDRCAEAQDGACEWVEGDCLAFCDALPLLGEKAGCDGPATEYDQCLVDAEACDIAASCAAVEAAYVACVAPFCAAHPTEPECMTIENGR